MKKFKHRPQHRPEIKKVTIDIDPINRAGEPIRVSRETEFHETPREIAELMCDLACVTEEDEVLDPSAGLGALLRPARERGASCVGVEKNWTLAEELRKQPYGFAIMFMDFLKMRPPGHRKPDIILMNPPFSRGQARKHVEHARGFLRPNGVLLAIVPENQIPEGFEKIKDLPPGTFKSAPGVHSCIIQNH